MHKSVGAIIKKDDKMLLMDRAIPPFGWAGPAGHIDSGESPEEAIIREVKEEVNLEVLEFKLLVNEFVEWNKCSKGVRGHDWSLFEITKWEGMPSGNGREEKKLEWVNIDDLKKINLEPVWEYWFKKLKII